MTSRIRLYSDLHLELRSPETYPALLDAITDGPAPSLTILAGDITSIPFALGPNGAPIIAFLRQYAERRGRVAYVLGNHELWGGDVLDRKAMIQDFLMAIGFRYTVLDRNSYFLGRQRILGCTLYWAAADQGNRDYQEVHNLHPWANEQGSADEAWLNTSVGPGDVVVTHIVPSSRCEDPRYAGRPSNRFFVRPMDGLIETAKPAVWCFGHTHCGVDLRAGDTRLLANPLGRVGEIVPVPFDPGLEFEV